MNKIYHLFKKWEITRTKKFQYKNINNPNKISSNK